MSEYNVQWFEEPIKDENNLYISRGLDFVNTNCPSTLILLSQNMVDGMFVAGGSCITMLDKYHPFGDIDVYTKSKDSDRYIQDLLKAWEFQFVSFAGKNQDVKKYTDGVVTVQTIHSTKIDSLRALLGSYDIEACKIGFDDQEVLFSAKSEEDIKQKRIRIIANNHDTAKLIMRICKYVAKGYEIDISEVKKILAGPDNAKSQPPINPQDDMLKNIETLTKAMERGMYVPPATFPQLPSLQEAEFSKYIQQPTYTPMKWVTTTGTTIPVPQVESITCSGCGKTIVKGASCYYCVGY